jgi:tRNA threonylcarbamoyladenosine biosynthesis protein TsaE
MKKQEIFITKNSNQTKKTGKLLSEEVILSEPGKEANVICLDGNLGGGKTTFLQGFARGLGIKDKILSPTFVILKRFSIKNEKNYNNFYHIDCYRIQNPKEMFILGFKEILSNPKNIIAIEWSKNIESVLHKKFISLQFDLFKKEERKITLRYYD